MGKSLRSKPKLRAKSIKRKGEFSKFVDDRNSRLAQKNLEHLQRQKEEKAAEAAKTENVAGDANTAADAADADAMTDSTGTNLPPVKLSEFKTSGWKKKDKKSKSRRNKRHIAF